MIDYLYLISSIVYFAILMYLIEIDKVHNTYIFIGLLWTRLIINEGFTSIINISIFIMNASFVVYFISRIIAKKKKNKI